MARGTDLPTRSPPPAVQRSKGCAAVGYRLVRALVRALLQVVWHLRVEGVERLPPRGPYILASNHSSEIDAVLLLAALPLRLTFLASQHLQQMPVVFWLIRQFVDPVWVRRELSDVGAIKACLYRLEAGEILAVFPEGRVIQEADLGPLHPGAAFLAIRGHVLIIPVALLGMTQMLPLGARWPRRAQVSVRVGTPLVPPTSNGDSAREFTEAIGRALRILLHGGARDA